MTERDLVARLRWPEGLPSPLDHPVSVKLRVEAADEIEKLRRNSRHWREECGKLHAKLTSTSGDAQTRCTCGSDANQPASHHDISCPLTISASIFEQVFIDACDEAGCSYDNEALLKAIADLKRAPAQARPDLAKRIVEFIDENDPFGDKFCRNDTKRIEAALADAQARQERSDLTKIAAECHRAKWQFDLSEDFQSSKAFARALILQAFRELHRIGDIALKLRDASPVSSTTRATPAVCARCNGSGLELGGTGASIQCFRCYGEGKDPAIPSTGRGREFCSGGYFAGSLACRNCNCPSVTSTNRCTFPCDCGGGVRCTVPPTDRGSA